MVDGEICSVYKLAEKFQCDICVAVWDVCHSPIDPTAKLWGFSYEFA